MNADIEIQINELIDKALEDSISAGEFAQLNQLVASDKEYAAYYISCIKYRDALHRAKSLLYPADPGRSTEQLLLEKLAEYETVAPTVSIEKTTPEANLESANIIPQEKFVRNIRKPFIVLSLVSLAAMLLLIFAIQFTPVSPREVATLVDVMNAGYTEGGAALTTGVRMRTDHGLITQDRGIVKWLYDSNVEVVIEAPARYEFESTEVLRLYSGRVFAKVPPSGRGFTVSTQFSNVVDLGTEFGVIAAADGDTEVHVFKGQTILKAGNPKEENFLLNLRAGNAGKICDNGATAKHIQVQPNAFVRQIDSQTGFVWKGENQVALVNLLAGNIFAASPAGIEINPSTGSFVQHGDFVSGSDHPADAEYHKITASPFMDGIFIPQGQQPQAISSTGLTYQFPATCGQFFFNLSDQKSVFDGMTEARYSLSLTSAQYKASSLFLHPNMGITFDLNKLRQQMPMIHIQRLQADCGIAAATAEALKKVHTDGVIPETERPSVDFVILLDGKTCLTINDIQMNSGTQKIDAPIEPTNRFLTLVATDSNKSTKYDWFVLTNAALKIAAAE